MEKRMKKWWWRWRQMMIMVTNGVINNDWWGWQWRQTSLKKKWRRHDDLAISITDAAPWLDYNTWRGMSGGRIYRVNSIYLKDCSEQQKIIIYLDSPCFRLINITIYCLWIKLKDPLKVPDILKWSLNQTGDTNLCKIRVNVLLLVKLILLD